MSAEATAATDRPPRLLYLLTSFNNGGAEWGAVELVKGGAFAGFDLSIVALVRGAGAQTEALRALGHSPEVLVEAARPEPLALVRAALRLRRRLKALAPDVLVLSLPHANLLGRLLRPTRPRPLVVSFEHNSRLARLPYELGYRLTSGRVDWMLADCRATAEAAAARLYRQPPPRLDVAPLISFPPRRLAESVHGRASGQPRHLVSAGRLTTPKNQAHLIAVLAALRLRGIDARLTLFGEGPLRPHLDAAARRTDAGDRICMPGHTPQWWRMPADLFVLASRHEGLCIAALEAMAAGLPVAAPAVGGLEDYGAAGEVLVLDGEDIDEDAERLAALLRDPGRLESMATAGRAMVAERYASAAIRDIYDDLNARLLQAATPARGRPRAVHTPDA